MVDTYRTEEEQIEAIKRWWKSDGMQTVGLIVLVACLYFAWQWWQGYSHNKAIAASDVFQQLVEADTAVLNGAGDAQALALIDTLKTEHSGTYSVYAALYAAKYAVQREDLATAESELKWALEQSPTEELEELARLRLARVLFAQNKRIEALSELRFDGLEAWHMKKYDLQGDIYLAENEPAQAKIAYEKALSFGDEGLTTRFIELKLNSIPSGVDTSNE